MGSTVTSISVSRALLSVSDKTGLEAFASRLHEASVELVSSGGTAAHLERAGIPVTTVSDVTGADEILGGRVKTLHPHIHGGILADLDDDQHRADLEIRGIAAFQLVVVNLYPFEEAVASGAPWGAVVEQIDIGGPAMVRAAAKNHAWVGAVTSPDQYDAVASAVEAGGLPVSLRRDLARAAFFRTAAYDAAIVGWLERGDPLPERLVIAVEKVHDLRYGENPHQAAAAYAAPFTSGWWRTAEQLQGKAMSFNNYLDTEAAWRLASDIPCPGAVIVKHTNACGAAVESSIQAAFVAAWDCDPLSAFGGVVALNDDIDVSTAEMIVANFVEVVVAPAISDDASTVLASKPNLRVLRATAPHGADLDLRRLEDGLLVQLRDVGEETEWRTAGRREPTVDELADLGLAWTVASHTKSNAIVVVKEGAAVGVGAGDQSRVGAAQRALARAGERAVGAVAASDGFFPFRDGVDALASAGITAIIEPGGSVRDHEVIAAADEHDLALVFTGRRHFRH